MPHMIAGVTAAPRWQWSSASGTVRGSCRGHLRPRIAGARPRGQSQPQKCFGPGKRASWTVKPLSPRNSARFGARRRIVPLSELMIVGCVAVDLADRDPERAVEVDDVADPAMADVERERPDAIDARRCRLVSPR